MPSAGDMNENRTPEALEQEIAELAAHIDAATWRLLQALREFDKQEAWGPGFLSCAHWLSWRTGMDLVTAREKVRVARALDGLPKISEAFRQGKVSNSKVRAMVRIATKKNEDEILHIAVEGTASHIEKLVRVYRSAKRGQDLEEVREQRERRYLDIFTDEDGMMVIRGRLPPEVGALVKKALEVAVSALKGQKKERAAETGSRRKKKLEAIKIESKESASPARDNSGESSELPKIRCVHDSAESPSAISAPSGPDSVESHLHPHDSPVSSQRCETIAEQNAAESSRNPLPLRQPTLTPSSCCPETFDQLYADALEFLAEAALGQGLNSTKRGEPYQVLVHVDAHTLAGSSEVGRSEIDNGEGISAETSRRISCDAPFVSIAHGGNGEVLHMGRKSRKISTPLWRALKSRDKACQFPGCNRSDKLQAHHIQHWAKGGRTDPNNLVLLCRAHHWAVHEGGFRIEGRTSEALAFIRPDGRTLPASPRPTNLSDDPIEALKSCHREMGLTITLETSACNWDGGAMDYDIALRGIMGAD